MASLFCLGLASYILPAQRLAGFGFETTNPGDWLVCHLRSEGRPERGFTSFLWSSTRLARQGWAHAGAFVTGHHHLSGRTWQRCWALKCE
jgi:hypothetical protein